MSFDRFCAYNLRKDIDMKSKIKRDSVLVAVILIISFISFLILHFFVKKNGSFVVVKVDGKVQYTISIKENRELEIEGYQGGKNHIVIKDGFAYMALADCPDKLCENMGKISKTGETIVCMPHRVVVEIVGVRSEVDSIVR